MASQPYCVWKLDGGGYWEESASLQAESEAVVAAADSSPDSTRTGGAADMVLSSLPNRARG